ncbi:YfhO family protein [Carnobacterium antarcticum]|uniref:YfhO family protein n=1 Tax=Carnobacterium antarcticum TaxID=2126436 RepID=A0ABW4NK42_9LACT|nr:YfhO family protein [Carnobacterium sp. CP1]ALV21859.1 hypothetical protein NY10_1251 [Carnobacterium sp. CP1]
MSVSNKKRAAYPFYWYTFLFALMVLVIYGYFFVAQKSFIWERDGFSQHYLIFKEYLEIVRDFLQQPSLGFKLWDWNIGLGADTIHSYGYYVVGDPFVYLGLLFPASQTELAFHVLILLRLYAIGAVFLIFCRKIGIAMPGALVGSLIYTFTYYVIMNATRHPFFLLPMVLFPLFCLGIERILQRQSNTLFIIAVFLGAFSNFYFFYMLTVLVFIYALVRYFYIYGKKDITKIVGFIWTAVYSYIIGVLLSGILFFPVVGGFLQSSREASSKFAQGLLVYPIEYYIALIRNLFIPGSYLWSTMGFSAFVILLLPCLFLHKKRYGFIKIMLLIFGVMLLLPAFGSVMNGFSGPYNRWTFVLPFFLAWGSAQLYNYRFQLSKRDLSAMAGSLIFFSLITGASVWVTGYRFAYVAPVFFAWLMWGVFYIGHIKQQNRTLGTIDKKGLSFLLTALVMGNLAYNAMDYYYPWGQNTVSSLLDYGTVDKLYTETFEGAEKLIQPQKAEEIYRIGVTSQDREVKNQLVLLDRMGLSSYLSITNGEVANFARKLESGQFQLIQPIRNGVDDRSIINHFLNVQAIVTEEKNEKYLPYGYQVTEKKSGKERSFIVAETTLAYPFAYAEDVYLPESTFEKMNPVEKEAFLSYGIVLDEKQAQTEGLSLFDKETESKKLTIDIFSEDENKLTIENQTIKVHGTSGKLTIKLKNKNEMEQSAIYVYLEGLHFEPVKSQGWKRDPINYTAVMKMGKQRKSIYQSDLLSFSAYMPRDKMLFHLGYQSEAAASDTISLQFDREGSYTVSDINVLALPLNQDYQERVRQKQKQALEITAFTNQKVSGTIEQEKASILTTTIPYTSGWQAEVNGKAIETLRVNEGFVGIPLEAGKSKIVLTYQTPLLKAGIAASSLGVLLLAANQIIHRKKRNDH